MRFFIWHINFDSVPKKVALLMESTSSVAQVTDWKIHEFFGVTTTNMPLAGVGLCASKAQLYKSFIETPGVFAISYPGAGPVVVAEWELPAKPADPDQYAICAAVIECSVESAAALRLWTAAKTSTGGSYPAYAVQVQLPKNPGQNGKTHVRGCWRKADTRWVVTGQMLDANFYCPTPPTDVWDQIESCDTDGAEAQYYSAENSIGFVSGADATNPTKNPGAFGANLRYTLRAQTSNGDVGMVVAQLMSRNTGWQYFGAARIINPVVAGERGIKPIPNADDFNVVSLNKAIPGEPPILVPPGVVTSVNIEIAHAGGATMPVTYRLTKLYVSWTGGGGAG
jgi:hypothetical protein